MMNQNGNYENMKLENTTSLELSALGKAFSDINEKIQLFYKECERLINKFDINYKELCGENDKLRAKIEEQENKTSAREVLDAIGCPLAALYNEIYRLPDGDTATQLIGLVENLNAAFENAGCTPIYACDDKQLKEAENNCLTERIEKSTQERAQNGGINIDKVGFYLDNKPCLKMRYITHTNNSSAGNIQMEEKDVSYPFIFKDDFDIIRYRYDTKTKKKVYMIVILSDYMLKKLNVRNKYFEVDMSYSFSMSAPHFFDIGKGYYSHCFRFYIDNKDDNKELVLCLEDILSREFSICIPLARI